MSNVKISALPTGTIAGTDTVPVVKAGVTTAVPFSHTHPQSDVASLVTDLAGKAAATHTHAESDVTGLVTDINNLKATVGPLRTALDQSGWGWINQGGASVSQSNGVVRLSLASESLENVRGRFTAAPATTPYSITALLYPGFMTTSGTCGTGIAFRESGTGKIVYIAYVGNAGGAGPKIHVRRFTNPTTNPSSSTTPQFMVPPIPGIWYRITDNGTNTIYAYSFNGVDFITQVSEPRGAGGFFTTAPDQVGITIQNFGSLQDTDGSFLSWVIS